MTRPGEEKKRSSGNPGPQLSLDSFHTLSRPKDQLRNCIDSSETLLWERLGFQELPESGAGRSVYEGASGSYG